MVNQQLLNNLGINEAAVENLNPISLSLINSLLLTIQEQAEELKVNQQQLLNYQVQVQGIKSQLERRKPRRLSLGNELTAEFTTINISPSSVSFSPHTPRSLNTPTISELGEIVEIVQQQEEVLEDSATQIITELQTQQESLQQQLQSLTQQLAQKESDLARSENQRQAKIAETAKLEQQISKLKTELTTRETELVDAETELTCISEDLSQAEEEKEKIKKYYLDALLKEKNARLELEKKLTHEITENQRLKNYQEETNTNLTTALNQLTELQRITHEERLELQQLIDEQEARYQAEKNEREIAFKKQMDNMRLFQLTAIREVNQAHPSQSNASLPTSLSNSPRHSICEENFTPRKNQTPLYFELLRKGNFFGSNEVEERRSSISSVMTNHSQLDKVFEEVLALTDLETETNQGCNSEEHQRLVAELTALEASTQELNAELLSWKEGKKKDWENEVGQLKYELQEMQARERRINQELQSKEEQIILFTEQLKNFQVASETERQVEAKQRLLLQTQNENLQTELEAVKNEWAAQNAAFTNLAANVRILEETNQQLSKELLNLKQTQKLRKSELKNLSELLAKPSQLLKETLVELKLENQILIK